MKMTIVNKFKIREPWCGGAYMVVEYEEKCPDGILETFIPGFVFDIEVDQYYEMPNNDKIVTFRLKNEEDFDKIAVTKLLEPPY